MEGRARGGKRKVGRGCKEHVEYKDEDDSTYCTSPPAILQALRIMSSKLSSASIVALISGMSE